jgi:crossover junction endodeoxyribonuclease RusA
MVVFNLPKPPSVNQLYRNVPRVGRVKTAVYRAWEQEAGWLLRAQRPQPVHGAYRLLALVGPTRADIGNLEKALSDLLQSCGVIDNDRLCQGFLMERSNDVPKDGIQCVVMEDEADTWVPLSDAVNQVLSNIGKGE